MPHEISDMEHALAPLLIVLAAMLKHPVPADPLQCSCHTTNEQASCAHCALAMLSDLDGRGVQMRQSCWLAAGEVAGPFWELRASTGGGRDAAEFFTVLLDRVLCHKLSGNNPTDVGRLASWLYSDSLHHTVMWQ